MYTELKEKQNAEWLEQNRLTPEQTKKLLQDKIARALRYQEAEKKRKALCGGR